MRERKERTRPLKFDHSKHWKGMPEFVQPNAGPIKILLVHFDTKEDMLKFSKLVGQQVTARTPSIWFPKKPAEAALDKRWSDKKTKKRKK